MIKKLDKIALLMLCEIHKHLGISYGFDPTMVREALITGNFWAIDQECGIIADEGISEHIRDDVFDMLDLWSFVEESYEALTPEEKLNYDSSDLPIPKFPGFDHNNEREYATCARFIVDTLSRFTRFSGRISVNAHMEVLDSYRRMIKVFESIRVHENGEGLLTLDELKRVTKAKYFP